ncbi:hypothetical protein NTGM5_70039 [Candidatus Nitrotoga sp. M5]|nr:hypothetical protein NTGM5_70039 [Candidatus Nitrotoga sp. M5]
MLAFVVLFSNNGLPITGTFEIHLVNMDETSSTSMVNSQTRFCLAPAELSDIPIWTNS